MTITQTHSHPATECECSSASFSPTPPQPSSHPRRCNIHDHHHLCALFTHTTTTSPNPHHLCALFTHTTTTSPNPPRFDAGGSTFHFYPRDGCDGNCATVERVDIMSLRQLMPVISTLRRQLVLTALLSECAQSERIEGVPAVEVLMVSRPLFQTQNQKTTIRTS